MDHPHPVPFTAVSLHDAFWAHRIETNRVVTIPTEYRQCKENGRLDAWKLTWKPGDPNEPHKFWDSDVAKWIEAVAYSLARTPDPALEARTDEVIDDMAAAQQEDGYLNTHFILVEPENRWTNLRDHHELYCAGHLMEAAVAYHAATGKRTLLEVMCRYADLIAQVFGPGPDQRPGYPGHEEIELALIKLFRATGEKRYLDLAAFFINERGRQPHYYDREAAERGEDPHSRKHGYEYCQAHRPVREQAETVGHSVRAMYLYAGMADVARETGDDTLLAPCRRLWHALTRKRLYVTGGIGSSRGNEGFSCDYDLPNEPAYAETCAGIGLIFWAHRMLHLDPCRDYADVMERTLYNNVAASISLSGDSFFYANPLAAYPPAIDSRADLGHIALPRKTWYGCACCPPNVARLFASLDGYVYSHSSEELRVHLYAGSQATIPVGGHSVRVTQTTDYPWDGEVQLRLAPASPVRFRLALRLPGWCEQPTLRVNNEAVDLESVTENGYACVERTWEDDDLVRLTLPMPVHRLHADTRVRQNAGRITLQRGPIVYCLEEIDNGSDLNAIVLPRESDISAVHKPDLLGGITVLQAEAEREQNEDWDDSLYKTEQPSRKPQTITAVPYAVWANRERGEMITWIRED